LGGFVFDEPGLGKTLQMLSLMQLNPDPLRRPTLVVCPSHLIQHWCNEAETHFQPGTFKIVKYFGSKRHQIEIPEGADIVITSYGTVMADYCEKIRHFVTRRVPIDQRPNPELLPSFRNDSILSRTWRRAIFDESHNFRNLNNISRAILSLQSIITWCITATPIMNKIDDLFTQVSVIGISPFDEIVHWKQYISSSMSVRPVSTFEIIMRNIIVPFGIRRTKEHVADLPTRSERYVWLDFTPREEELYSALLQITRERVNRLLENIRIMSNPRNAHQMGRFLTRMRMGIMVFLLRLRQCCCHPSIMARKIIEHMQQHSGEDVPDDDDSDLDNISAVDQLERAIQILQDKISSGLEEECGICFDATATHSNGNCSHRICVDCATHMLRHNIATCPICRAFSPNWYDSDEAILRLQTNIKRKRGDPLVVEEVDDNVVDITQVEIEADPLLSVKAKWVHDDMLTHNDKVVIVSQWVEHLEVYKELCRRMGWPWCWLTGKTSAERRHRIVDAFQKDDTYRVCLLSMSSSAEGINLTSACRVYHVDPWWNDSKTTQASDRVHRIGQTQDVTIVHLRINNTIEEAMHSMQEQKKEIFDVICGKKIAGEHMKFANQVRLLLGTREREAYDTPVNGR
jgi:SNF2 family DNA or RNA helicase